LGLGTYLGADDGETDVLYQDAIVRALELGVNVLDTAVNYRHQRSERAIRTALATRSARESWTATSRHRHQGRLHPFDGAVPECRRTSRRPTRAGIVSRERWWAARTA